MERKNVKDWTRKYIAKNVNLESHTLAAIKNFVEDFPGGLDLDEGDVVDRLYDAFDQEVNKVLGTSGEKAIIDTMSRAVFIDYRYKLVSAMRFY